MDVDERVANVAAALAEPARARMLCALMDGRAKTATELAAVGSVAASTASAHLQKLGSSGLVSCVAQGKHRYFRLATDEAADAVEALMRVAALGVTRAPVRRLPPLPLRLARACYDHPAGEFGVALYERFLTLKWLSSNGESVTPAGRDELQKQLGVDCSTLNPRRRFAYPCLDWSERKFHLGGALGAALLQGLIAKRWVLREPGSRALDITSAGRRGLASIGVRLQAKG